MKCPKCYTENRKEAEFCKECGNKFDVFCPECGISIQPVSKFCDKCGHNLQKFIEPPDHSEPQSYTPKFLADKILTSRSSIEGERKLVTVFFADVANYTTLSEKLDPEEVHQIMDGCFRILMDEIHQYEGTINQFTGDGVMALFGAPKSHEDHARRACLAALAVQKAVTAYGEKIAIYNSIPVRGAKAVILPSAALNLIFIITHALIHPPVNFSMYFLAMLSTEISVSP
jgi:hypothetical protein